MISSDGELDMGVGDADESTPSYLPSIQNIYYINKFMIISPVSPLNSASLLMVQNEKPDNFDDGSTIIDGDLYVDKLPKTGMESCDNSLLRDVAIRLDSLTHKFEKHQTESNVVLSDLISTLEAFESSISTECPVRENSSL